MEKMHIGVNSDAYYDASEMMASESRFAYGKKRNEFEEDFQEDAFREDDNQEDIVGFEEATVTDEEIAAFTYETDPEKIKLFFDQFHYGTQSEHEYAAEMIRDLLSGLVISIGKKHFPTYMKNPQEREELIMNAWCGVYEAAYNYDPSRAAPTTFFYRPILHEMNEYIARFLNKSTSYSMLVRKKIKEATDRLSARGVRNPCVLDIAYESGMKASAVRKAQESQYYAASRSLEEMVMDPGEYSQSGKSTRAREDYDVRPAGGSDFGNPFAFVSQKENLTALYDALNKLPPSQRDILCRRFGLEGYDAQNYTTIFNETGITTDRIKAMEQQAMNRMRMNSDLRRNYRGGKANEIKEDLDFEPVCVIPDQAALTMMNLLDNIESVEI